MNENKFVNFLVGLGCLILAYSLFFGVNPLAAYSDAQLAEGNVGAGFTATALLVWNFVFTAVAALGGFVLVKGTQAFKDISRVVNNWYSSNIDSGPTTVASKNSKMTGKKYAAYSEILMESIDEGDASMTVTLAEKINGTNFLTKGKK